MANALRLEALRDEAGLTQTQLADIVGSTQVNISRLEAGGRQRADLDLLVRICQALSRSVGRDVTMADLLPVPKTRKR